MGLKTNTTINGLQVQDAYVRVDRLFGSKREGWSAVVSVYATQAAANDGVQPLTVFNHSTPYVENTVPYQALYESIKTDLYPEAISC